MPAAAAPGGMRLEIGRRENGAALAFEAGREPGESEEDQDGNAGAPARRGEDLYRWKVHSNLDFRDSWLAELPSAKKLTGNDIRIVSPRGQACLDTAFTDDRFEVPRREPIFHKKKKRAAEAARSPETSGNQFWVPTP